MVVVAGFIDVAGMVVVDGRKISAGFETLVEGVEVEIAEEEGLDTGV